MLIDQYHSTDDLANLASIITKLNSDLNAVREMLRRADADNDRKAKEIESLKSLVDNFHKSGKVEVVDSVALPTFHPDIP